MHETSPRDRRLIQLHLDHFDRRNGATPISVGHRRDNLERLTRALPCDLLDATDEHLIAWQAAELKRRNSRGELLARNTIATYSTHVRGFYRWAFEAGHLDANPAARLPNIKRDKGRPRPIPEPDLQTALICADPRIRIWLILASFMGLRAMEIAQLRRESVSDVDGRLVISALGKGRKPFTMVVPKHVEPELRAHLGADNVLWRTQTGAACNAKYISRMVGEFFKKQGQPYRLHWGRHAFGTAVYAQTKDLLLAQDLMRHASPETTRLYVATGGKAGVRALDKLAGRGLSPSRRARPVLAAAS